jgi:hypothetical protein
MEKNIPFKYNVTIFDYFCVEANRGYSTVRSLVNTRAILL